MAAEECDGDSGRPAPGGSCPAGEEGHHYLVSTWVVNALTLSLIFNKSLWLRCGGGSGAGEVR